MAAIVEDSDDLSAAGHHLGRVHAGAFLGAATIFTGLHYLSGITRFPFDSGEYWELASSLPAFPESHRGYVLALLLWPAAALAQVGGLGFHPYRLLSALMYGLAFTTVVPAFYTHFFGGRVTQTRLLVVPVLVTILFPALILYPNSDLPAVLLLMLCFLLWDHPGQREHWARYSWLRWTCAGILAGAVYNIRTIYLISVMMLVVIGPGQLPGRGRSPRWMARLLFVFGVVLAAAPQASINARHTGSASPLVQAGHIYRDQLRGGIILQRYETSVDPDDPGPRVYYLDPSGRRLLASEGLTVDDIDLHTYVRLLVRHPMDFVGIFGRHIANGLDLRYGEIFLTDARDRRHLAGFANYFVLFLGGWILAVRTTGRGGPARRLMLRAAVVLLLPVALIVPGAIEVRFFLPLYLLTWSAVAFDISTVDLGRRWRARPVQLMVVFLLGLLVHSAIVLATLDHLSFSLD